MEPSPRSLPRLSRPALAARQRAEEALATILAAELGFRMPIVLTRNRRILLAVRRDRDGRAILRMHRAFVQASRAELAIIAAWVAGRPGATAAARTLIDRYSEAAAAIAPPLKSRRGTRPSRHHDLVGLLHGLLAEWFPAMPPVLIAWAAWTRGRRQRQLGSWNGTTRLIRIHPCLDAADVPREVIEAVVFHELCHAATDVSLTPTGKRRIHGAEFRRLEQRYPHRAAVKAWEAEHLGRLLSRGRR